jgi:Xaa-Pro dipeptidase
MNRPTEPPRGFPQAEFESRLERAQYLMAEAGFDALLLSTEPEVRYFSGFLTQFWQSPTRPWFLVVPGSGKPIAVIPEIGAPLMRRTWLDDIRSWPSPRPDDEGVSLLADTLRGIGASRIGVPMGPETTLRMPLRDYGQLRELLPGAVFADATDLVRALRTIKSEAEIAKIAHICTIASDAFAAVPDLACPGQPLAETFRAFRIALLTRGADDVPYLVGAAAPGGYDDVISPPDDRPLREGDMLMMDTGAVHDGYFCDFDRNYAIGKADDAARRAYETLYRATEAGLAAARPGASSADLFRAMQAVIAADGHECGNVGRLGHGLGMQLTEWPSHTATDRTVLVPGMVLTLEPGLRIGPGRTMVHEENIVIREHGAEFLSRRAPPELPVLT